MSKNTRTRILLTAVAALLLVVMTVGGTLAWLVDTTDEVKNTFIASDIAIKLEETANNFTDIDEDGIDDAWVKQIIPGTTVTKDPVVTVVRPETSVDIYLFVKYVKTENGTTDGVEYLQFTNNLDGWNKVTGETNVYYKEIAVGAEAADVGACTDADCAKKDTLHWHLIDDDQVTFNSALTADDTDSASITMTYEAWAIQKDGVGTVAEAWAKVKDATPATDDSTAGITN